jgi:CRP-like cAMP-binding protein
VTRSRLLELLDDAKRGELTRQSRRRRFKRNEVVFHDGDPGDTLHIVMKGHFAVRITTPLGDTATLRVVGPGDHFGELAVLAPAARTGSVVALDRAETLCVTRDVVDDLRARYPEVERALTQALILEVRRLAAALVDALYVPTEQRLWRRLRELAAVYGTIDRSNGHDATDGSGADGSAGAVVSVPITQDDLAQMVGTTRSTANRILRTAVDRGTIRLGRGRVEILDLDDLEHLAR